MYVVKQISTSPRRLLSGVCCQEKIIELQRKLATSTKLAKLQVVI